MLIVLPTWLDACETSDSRADESHHLLEAVASSVLPSTSSQPTKTYGNSSFYQLEPYPLSAASFRDRLCEQLERNQRDDSVLFSECHFHLVGFDENDHLLAKLIRRGMGIIHWELTPQVTHVLVKVHADPSVR